MTDNAYAHPRLAKLYDGFEGDRSDLDCYDEGLSEAGVRSALDVGCGTGVFALRLSGLGLEITGVDPGAGMIGVARAKPCADAVRWIVGEAADALPIQVDAVTMTANVATVFTSDGHWNATLQAIHAALRLVGSSCLSRATPPTAVGSGGVTLLWR
ncbi:class I SAM-dependent DNA methyltransferase [Brevibacterium sp. UBA7493]|uniref:class I SAM-dependent DNA methyltransferase n=1 Tax=Brevibacterium sp. UBA7493 TaxID=1946121 RepID=UPI00257C9974|nr:class I SAM-dependent methyltransferase [Brevibacterium sp. UBA7493]